MSSLRPYLVRDTSDTLTDSERDAMARELASHGVKVDLVARQSVRRASTLRLLARAALIALGFVAFFVLFAYAATIPQGVGP